MITDHVWRPVNPTTAKLGRTPFRRRPCAYLSCRKPISQHVRAITAAGAR